MRNFPFLLQEVKTLQPRSLLFSDILKFNPYHDRLGRFSTAGGAASMTIRTRSKLWQNAADNAIGREKERVRQADKVISGTNKMASYVADKNMISTDKRQCINDIKSCYQKIAMNNSVRYDDEKQKVICKKSAFNDVKDTARKIISKQEYEDGTTSQEYHELQRTIKNTPVKISDYDKSNIPDWNDFKKRAFGNITISNNGIPIDSLYQELSSKLPHLFNSQRETNPADQLQKINDTLKMLKPRKYKLTGKDLEDATEDLALQIMSGYLHVVSPKFAAS